MTIYVKPVWQLLIDFADENLEMEGSDLAQRMLQGGLVKNIPTSRKGL